MIYMFGLFLRFCCNKLQLPADLLDLLADAGPPRLQNTHARPTTTGTPVRSNFNEEVVVRPGPCQAQWKKLIKLTTVSSCKESTNLNKNNTVGGCGRRSSGMGLKNGHCFSSVKNGKQGICHIIIQAFLTACRFAGLHYIRGKTPWIKIKGPSNVPSRLPCTQTVTSSASTLKSGTHQASEQGPPIHEGISVLWVVYGI